MSLVSTEWLDNNHSEVKIIDASWHMPNTNRNAYEEYKKEHIKNAIFFDIDKFSNKKTELPHMLPNEEEWEKIVSNLGITNEDRIIVYDNSDVISSCRCWYTFIFFGHNPNLISVLNGGFLKWKKENRETSDKVSNYKKKNYRAKKIPQLVKSKEEIDKNILEKKFQVVDARSKNRFLGLEKEPRLGVRSGSIQNSYCLPFGELINPKDKTFIENNLIKEKFINIGVNNEKNIIIIEVIFVDLFILVILLFHIRPKSHHK